MQLVAENIKEFFQKFNPNEIKSFEKLPKSGGDRIYFRIATEDNSYIATFNENVKENNAFLNFTYHLKKINAPLPEIYKVHPGKEIYIQEDFGDTSLLNKLEENGFNDYMYNLFKKSLKNLAWLQIEGNKDLDYGNCITSKEFGKQAILSDLLYFKYYFLDPLKIAYDKEKLIDDFEALSNYLTHVPHKYFMFRDFQSRNIMVTNDDNVHFIDYQGGMQGAPQYDVASLLWQAKATLPDEWKQSLLEDYMDSFEKIIEQPVDRDVFRSQYNGYVLIRLLQVLGAYGFRGLFERKAHFLTSIPLALENLKWFINNQGFGISVPEFKRVLEICISDEVINEYTPVKATDETPLLVTINSFSYRKGIPIDVTENGGGFVFDMRGIFNPGRFEDYKKFSGLDKTVKDFLEQQTEMPVFLNGVYSIIDISVTEYIKRGFASLMINFGCTGGQHRSVYAAEAIARHLRNKFNVKVQLSHNNKENWVR